MSTTTTRIVWAATLAAVVALVAVVLLRGGESVRIHAQFTDAGQLVRGGEVQVAGRKVGSIAKIRLTDDGLADVELQVDDPAVLPLHEGTRATIRAVGQAGVANRYVRLDPGPRSLPKLRDGHVLPVTGNRGIVDLDAILNSLDAPARADLQGLVRSGSAIYAGSGAPEFNRMIQRLSPAVAELRRTTAELATDAPALQRLVRDGARAAGAIADRRDDVVSAIQGTAVTMRAIADRREELGRTLERAPDVLRRARRTLGTVDEVVADVRPALRDVPAAARPLTQVLRRLEPTLERATPAVRSLDQQLPAVRRVLAAMPALTRAASPALRKAVTALDRADPILAGIRIYGSDFVLGVFNGLAGIATGNFNEVGHYARLEFVQSPQTLPGGALAELLSKQALVPGIINTRTGLTARCPGGMAPPSEDGSSPWRPDASLCDPSHDRSSQVNVP